MAKKAVGKKPRAMQGNADRKGVDRCTPFVEKNVAAPPLRVISISRVFFVSSLNTFCPQFSQLFQYHEKAS
jgi:hypothetical protein